MDSARDSIARPLRKMRKLLGDFPAIPSPSEVHSLRTQTRRLEAILDAVAMDSGKDAKRILKTMTPLRKAAGRVRDMDVLIGNVFTLSKHDRSGASVRLVEHLSGLREKHARRLYNTVAKQGKKARRVLKRFADRIKEKSHTQRHVMTETSATLQMVTAELEYWPKLDAENLHAFRLGVKKLRYLLQFRKTANKRQMDAVVDVKDAIGDWHDWTELLKIAGEVLDPKEDRAMLKQIERGRDRRYRVAVHSANLLRRRGFGSLISGAVDKTPPTARGNRRQQSTPAKAPHRQRTQNLAPS